MVQINVLQNYSSQVNTDDTKKGGVKKKIKDIWQEVVPWATNIWGIPKVKMQELTKNEKLLGRERTEGRSLFQKGTFSHSELSDGHAPIPHRVPTTSAASIVRHISGQNNLCQDDQVHVEFSTVSTLEI